ncbi:hypothetical protein ACFFX0_01580 [Citricoccus parietis]|uniref:Uncharacterized protein n=1 Tax=Citricoccus parietis TaxID=592307 RepID=A0ABV5FTE2_9MICC
MTRTTPAHQRNHPNAETSPETSEGRNHRGGCGPRVVPAQLPPRYLSNPLGRFSDDGSKPPSVPPSAP